MKKIRLWYCRQSDFFNFKYYTVYIRLTQEVEDLRLTVLTRWKEIALDLPKRY